MKPTNRRKVGSPPAQGGPIFFSQILLRKELKTMEYEKPEVVALASALKAIAQDLPSKPPGPFLELYHSQSPIHTNGAYQADE